MRKLFLVCWLFSMALFSIAQKRIAQYPVELKEGGNFLLGNTTSVPIKSLFLQDPVTQEFMLLLMDNKTSEYVLFDNNKKVKTHFSLENEFKKTFSSQKQNEYLGGTAGNGKYYFVFKVKTAKAFGYNTTYQLMTVDPDQKDASTKELFNIPKGEKLLVSFGNFGQYYSIATDNDAQALKIYGLNAAGESFTKTIPVQVPSESSKKKLSDYLDDIKVISETEEAGLETATEKVKLFHTPSKIAIVVNEKDNPTRVLSIDTHTFTVDDKTIDHSSLTSDDKGKTYINSFLFHDNLYSLIVSKKNMTLAIYDINTKQMLQKHEFDENTNMQTFAQSPVEETRKGKRDKEKDIDDMKKLMKILDSGDEAVLVNEDKKGKLSVTIGTYEPIKISSGGGGTTYYTTTYVGNSYSGPNATSTSSYGNGFLTQRNYIPGATYMSVDANYYKTTQFKLLLDSSTLKLARGMASSSVAEQIKDYVGDVDKKHVALNQFNVGEKQYLGYYSKDEKHT